MKIVYLFRPQSQWFKNPVVFCEEANSVFVLWTWPIGCWVRWNYPWFLYSIHLVFLCFNDYFIITFTKMHYFNFFQFFRNHVLYMKLHLKERFRKSLIAQKITNFQAEEFSWLWPAILTKVKNFIANPCTLLQWPEA